MEFIEAAKELGPVVVLLIVGVLIIWSNQRSNTQQATNTGTALKLVSDSQDTTKKTLEAIEGHTAEVQHAVSNMSSDVSATLQKAADNATVERIAHRRQLDEQFALVISQLETIQQAVNGGVTLTDFRALSDDLRTIITDVKTSLIEIKTAVNMPPVA